MKLVLNFYVINCVKSVNRFQLIFRNREIGLVHVKLHLILSEDSSWYQLLLSWDRSMNFKKSGPERNYCEIRSSINHEKTVRCRKLRYIHVDFEWRDDQMKLVLKFYDENCAKSVNRIQWIFWNRQIGSVHVKLHLI